MSVFEKTQKLYDSIYPGSPPTDALEGILLSSFHESGQTVLVLDALDELPEDRDEDGRPAVLEWLENIVQESVGLKVFVTSRQLGDIETVMSRVARCVTLQPHLANRDIRKYVATELENHPKLRTLTSSTKEKVKEVFEVKSDGMFRWASCQLEVLKNLKSMRPKYIEEALHCLPRTLDATYERMLVQIDTMYHDEALTALRWLVFQLRPLTLLELAEACSINTAHEPFVEVDGRGRVEDILDILAGLVIVEDWETELQSKRAIETNEKSLAGGGTATFTALNSPHRRVRLAHFSVKEYLLSGRILDGKAAKFALTEQSRHVMAQDCIAYMLYYSQSLSKTKTQEDLHTFPLLRYAAESWTKLMLRCEPPQLALEMSLLQSEDAKKDWLALYQPDRPGRTPFIGVDQRRGSALYYTSFLGLLSASQRLLELGADPRAKGGFHANALCAASSQGHAEIVELLLDSGADVNLQPEDEAASEVPAIQVASYGGHTKVVKLLIDRGANVNTTSTSSSYPSPLYAASREGHKEIAKLLVDNGADVNAPGRLSSRRTALHAAVLGGHAEILELLVSGGADVNTPGDSFEDNALYIASYAGFTEIVKVLLSNGANIDAQDGHGNALHVAAHTGHIDIVQHMLDWKVSATGRDKFGWTPAMIAHVRGHVEIFEMLSSAGNSLGSAPATPEEKPSRLVGPHAITETTLINGGLTLVAKHLADHILVHTFQCRANYPMPFSSEKFYFEVTVIQSNPDSILGIGVCEDRARRLGMPGWMTGSWGYHGDDGYFFGEQSAGKKYGPVYATGDVVGCGGEKSLGTVFFTKNGQHLGVAVSGVRTVLFAVIGVGSSDVEVSVNFGATPFLYEAS